MDFGATDIQHTGTELIQQMQQCDHRRALIASTEFEQNNRPGHRKPSVRIDETQCFSSMTARVFNWSMRAQGALLGLLAAGIAIVLMVPASILVQHRLGQASVERYGSTITAQLAALAATPVVTHDRIDLNVITTHLADDAAIVNTAIYTVDNRLISTGGRVPAEATRDAPESTVFIVLADHMPAELVTIASRCIRIDFSAIADDVVAATLRAEGVPPEQAQQSAQAAKGDLSRARLLAVDPNLVVRREMFAQTPYALDGTGRAVVAAVDEIIAAIEAAAAPLVERHAGEVTALEQRIAAMGERGSGKKALEERHKRELRRHRTDELRSGLVTLGGAYRDALVAGHLPRPDSAATAISRIHASLEAFERNPNEQLLLQSLLLGLPSIVR